MSKGAMVDAAAAPRRNPGSRAGRLSARERALSNPLES